MVSRGKLTISFIKQSKAFSGAAEEQKERDVSRWKEMGMTYGLKVP